MQDTALTLMHSGEDSWWYRGRRVVARDLCTRFLGTRNSKNIRILDVGAGFGAMYHPLDSFGTVEAFEPDARLEKYLRDAGYAAVHMTWESMLGLKQAYDCVGAFDVIEHAPDDVELLKRIYGSLSSGGVLIVSVPAYRWLWSKHDTANLHFRRYTAKTLRRSLSMAGFHIKYISYWNTFLFPLAAVARVFGFSGGSSFRKRGVTDTFFGALVSFESQIMRFISLPFGLSVFAVAVKVR